MADLLNSARRFGGNLLGALSDFGAMKYAPRSPDENLESLAGTGGVDAAREAYDPNFRMARDAAIQSGQARWYNMNDFGHAGASQAYQIDLANAASRAEALRNREQTEQRRQAVRDYISKATGLEPEQKDFLNAADPDLAQRLLGENLFNKERDGFVFTPVGNGQFIVGNRSTGEAILHGVPNAGAEMDPNSVEMAAEYYLQHGKMPTGLSRGLGKFAPQILNRAAELAAERGDTVAEATMRSRANEANKGSLKLLTEQYHGVVAYESSMKAHLQNAVDISNKLDRSGVPVIDRWVLAGQKAIEGDPDVAAFHVAIMSAMDEYAKILSGGVRSAAAVTEGARTAAETMLNMASSPEQFLQVQQLINLDAEQKRIALQNQRMAIMDEMQYGTNTIEYGPAPTAMPSLDEYAKEHPVGTPGTGGTNSPPPGGAKVIKQ